MKCCKYKSPIGNLYISADETALYGVSYTPNIETGKNIIIEKTIQQLEEYFLRKRRLFNLPLNINGTAFQKKVWEELIKIPFGQTRRYKDIAIAIGNPNAYRAVGNANNKNPLAIIIPCHRVIGANGCLIGYAGGIDKKQLLLNFEKGF